MEGKHNFIGVSLLSGSASAGKSQLDRHNDAISFRIAMPGSQWIAPVSAANADGNIVDLLGPPGLSMEWMQRFRARSLGSIAALSPSDAMPVCPYLEGRLIHSIVRDAPIPGNAKPELVAPSAEFMFGRANAAIASSSLASNEQGGGASEPILDPASPHLKKPIQDTLVPIARLAQKLPVSD